jgi:hypothetical protein
MELNKIGNSPKEIFDTLAEAHYRGKHLAGIASVVVVLIGGYIMLIQDRANEIGLAANLSEEVMALLVAIGIVGSGASIALSFWNKKIRAVALLAPLFGALLILHYGMYALPIILALVVVAMRQLNSRNTN